MAGLDIDSQPHRAKGASFRAANAESCDAAWKPGKARGLFFAEANAESCYVPPMPGKAPGEFGRWRSASTPSFDRASAQRCFAFFGCTMNEESAGKRGLGECSPEAGAQAAQGAAWKALDDWGVNDVDQSCRRGPGVCAKLSFPEAPTQPGRLSTQELQVLKSASTLCGRAEGNARPSEALLQVLPRVYSQAKDQELLDWAMAEAKRQLCKEPMLPAKRKCLRSRPKPPKVLDQLAAMGVECRRLKLLISSSRTRASHAKPAELISKASASMTISTMSSGRSTTLSFETCSDSDNCVTEGELSTYSVNEEESINEEESMETSVAAQSTVCSMSELESMEKLSLSMQKQDSDSHESLSSDSGSSNC